MRLLLQNGQILSKDNTLIKQDILIEGSKVVQMASEIQAEDKMHVIPLAGKLVIPGLIDMHVHLREPGFEKKETIETGSLAAARGGFTTIACMPNTRPVIDTPETVEKIIQEAKRVGKARVLPLGAITIRELGQELTDFRALKKAGIVALSDDGVGVQNSHMMKEAMRKAHELGLSIVAHCEDDTLAKSGCVHDGEFAKKHGLLGIPNEAEAIHVGRDILLAEDVGVHYHVCHISTEQSVRLVREAKSRGQKVTAEVTPHHLLLTDREIPGLDPLYKMNPPLRSAEDRAALIAGLKDGTIEIIATDHAPHTLEEKAMGMEQAPFGIVGLETAFPLMYTHLVCTGELLLSELVEKMTRKPAEIFGLPYGELAEGKRADLTVIDLEIEKEIDPASFYSKGKNTPFTGWKCKGWPVLTLLNGMITYQENEK
ncbi:dihydroorotase [Thermoactinomyces sp. DSM 45892]|uniref:dihydroorotase n=1 Tax=Thermoactinomyces sp. DSM 45892 TaxID=1882753 RepID=UPI0008979F02|nr:dihydroorotase [Thermoactinomyces sp. DSM 45892]SDY59143.1 dihydroorotase [Thermoactinomyces sp. DSM 45892]